MTRSHILGGFLLFAILPTAVFAAETQSHSPELETLELQYLATNNPAQRKHVVSELKTLTKKSPEEDGRALNAAVSAMLPEAESIAEAEALLAIAAAHPAVCAAGQVEEAPKDAEFLVDPKLAAQETPRKTGDVELLADIRIDHLRKDSLGHDGLTTSHIQQVWRINSVQGARRFSPLSVRYASMSEALCIVRAQVLKRNGRKVEAVVSADHPVVEKGSSMYFDSLSRNLRFRKLDSGDVVEVEYYLLPETEVNPWGEYYAQLDLVRDSSPTRIWRRVVIAPTTMKLYAVEHELRPAVVQHIGDETTRIWEVRGTNEQLSGEVHSPGVRESVPYLHISTIGSMKELGLWYNGLLEPALKLDERLRTVAEQILAQNLSTRGKVQAVYEVVQRSTKYTAFEFGVHSYQPYSVATVERRGFGDCKDKAAMIVALLRAVGVPAEFAMVRTLSAAAVAPEAYSVQLFDHAVAYVPELNLYLDGTAGHNVAPGELPSEDQGAVAMTVDAEGKVTRHTVPFSAPESDRVTREARAKVGRNGKVESASQMKFAGYFSGEHGRMKAGEAAPEKNN